jgi:hypothetical protein
MPVRIRKKVQALPWLHRLSGLNHFCISPRETQINASFDTTGVTTLLETRDIPAPPARKAADIRN